MPSFDHMVTQWMSPSYGAGGRAWISSQVQDIGRSTRPSTRNDQFAVSILGVTSAVSTGQDLPVSYCPGGSRGSRPARRPVNPRVNRPTHDEPNDGPGVLRPWRLRPCSGRTRGSTFGLPGLQLAMEREHIALYEEETRA